MILTYSRDITTSILSYSPYSSRISLSKTSKGVHNLLLSIFIKSRECKEALEIINSLSLNEWNLLKFSTLYPLTITLGAFDQKERMIDSMSKALIIAERNLLFKENSIFALNPDSAIDLYYKSKLSRVSKAELLLLAHSCKISTTPILERDKLLYFIVKALSNFSLKKAYKKSKNITTNEIAIQAFTFLIKKGASLNKHTRTLKSLKRSYGLLHDFNKHDLGCFVVRTLSYLPNKKKINNVKTNILNDLSTFNLSIFHIPLQCELFKYLAATKQDTQSTLNTINELCALIPFTKNQHPTNALAALKAATTLKELYPEHAKMYLTMIESEINKIDDPFIKLKYSAQLYPLLLELNNNSPELLNSILNLIPKNKDNIWKLELLYPLLKPILQMTESIL